MFSCKQQESMKEYIERGFSRPTIEDVHFTKEKTGDMFTNIQIPLERRTLCTHGNYFLRIKPLRESVRKNSCRKKQRKFKKLDDGIDPVNSMPTLREAHTK